ncbi:PcfK-like family protein [Porphyromonas cangingivalis]|uniref:PcfK-like family protein n=1 Tax=Porphyromonas cangingivalis TaxID=36874 RepID=UPI00242DFE65|nr:Cas9 inhibitor AcrIIA9 family protein [Porphyromonas cangingivalis]
MSTSDNFKKVIKDYLDKRAENDPLFAVKYNNKDKSIEKCLNYIINEVKKMKVTALTDMEVFGLAIHYYDENDIKDHKAPQCTVVVSSPETIERPHNKKRSVKKISPVASSIQMPLFDL